MDFKHTSVLFNESLEALNIKAHGVYVDGTLGGGGHGEGICKALGESGTFIGIDRDKDALSWAEKRLEPYPCKKYFIQGNYSGVEEYLKNLNIPGIDGAILDLGVSSFQLDNAERGFSYMQDAPLDMRMDQTSGSDASFIVNNYSQGELARIIKDYGEERWASRIAGFIVKERNEKLIETTGELVDIIKRAIPASARREGPHPAKRTFQALRIEVNDELGQLEEAVEAFVKVANPGGRISIITFHSLEDRIVKDGFTKGFDPCTCPREFPICNCGKTPYLKKVTGKPVVASKEELEVNPRSRSAKLRVVEKI